MIFQPNSSKNVIKAFGRLNSVLKNPMNYLFRNVKQLILCFSKQELTNDAEQEFLQFGICAGPERSPLADELFFTSNYHY